MLAQAVCYYLILTSVTLTVTLCIIASQKNIIGIGVLTLLWYQFCIHWYSLLLFDKWGKTTITRVSIWGDKGPYQYPTGHYQTHWLSLAYPLWDIWGLTILVALVQQGKEWVHNSWGESTSYLGVRYYWVSKNHNLVLISWEPESSGGSGAKVYQPRLSKTTYLRTQRPTRHNDS